MLDSFDHIKKALDDIAAQDAVMAQDPNRMKVLAELRAHNRASICCLPIYTEKEGRRVFDKEGTNSNYQKMYKIFLTAELRNNA